MSQTTNWYENVDFHPEKKILLEVGSRGKQVRYAQSLLKGIGYNIEPDGKYGPNTRDTVKVFQADVGVVVDGKVGEKTLRLLKQHPKDPRVLTQADIEEAAFSLDVDVAAVMAVNEVESRGSGFFDGGKPAILYERHVMRRRLKERGIDPLQYQRAMPNIVNAATGGYKGGLAEYDRLNVAKGINRGAALESASWGAFQIMGYHWRRLGYPSVQDFVKKMHGSEGEHLKAFVAFVKADDRLHEALKEKDWATFARYYNGPAYAKHQYDTRMANAYYEYSEALVT